MTQKPRAACSHAAIAKLIYIMVFYIDEAFHFQQHHPEPIELWSNGTMEYHESIKMILGDMGIKIMQVLRFGAMDLKSIEFLSGVPMACVKGRIPVLKSLNLIKEHDGSFSLDKAGELFLDMFFKQEAY